MKDDQTATLELTRLLAEARDGDSESMDALVAEVYQQLQRTAGGMLKREAPGLTLAATDVVHEAYFKLFRGSLADWQDRRHFFGSAANAMRQVLVEHARRKQADKRIPKNLLEEVRPDLEVFEIPNLDILALDHALDKLAEQSPRQAQVVELRFFAGLSESEVAEVLGVSRMTITRDWQVARLRLFREISDSLPG